MTTGANQIGGRRVPFPSARRSRALQQEDAFLELHGGVGSRLIFLAVTGIEAALRGVAATVRATRRCSARVAANSRPGIVER